MNFCVVQQVQETSVIMIGCQLYPLPQKIHIKSDCVCARNKNAVWLRRLHLHGLWTGLEQSSFSYLSLAPLLSGTVKGDVHNLHQDPHNSRSVLPMPSPKLTAAELQDFCSTSSMPLIGRLACIVLFFFFVACKGAQLLVWKNKILFSVTKQITACEMAVQVSVLTYKEMKEYRRL